MAAFTGRTHPSGFHADPDLLYAMKWLPFLLILLALGLLWLAKRQREQTGLPGGRVVYADMGRWQPNSQAIYDPKRNLAGKPDYLVYKDGIPIPVEVKSGRTPAHPYDSHIFQLAAYCYLVETATGKTPPYGILHYPQQTFEIKYTPELKNALFALIDDMRLKERLKDSVDRSHEHAARCQSCSYRDTCDQRLAA